MPSARSHRSLRGGGCLPRLVVTAVCLAVALGAAMVGAIVYRERLAAELRDRLRITVSRANLDIKRMSAKRLPLRVTVEVDNRLPLGGVVETASFSVCISGRDVGAGRHVGQATPVPGYAKTGVRFDLEIDADRTRRALQNAVLRTTVNLAHKLIDTMAAGRGHAKPNVVPLRVAGAVRVTVLSVPLILPIDSTVDLLLTD